MQVNQLKWFMQVNPRKWSMQVNPQKFMTRENDWMICNAAPPNEAFCYTWNETDGGRGSNEIGTRLLKWIRSLPTNVTEYCLFSQIHMVVKSKQANSWRFGVNSANDSRDYHTPKIPSTWSFSNGSGFHAFCNWIAKTQCCSSYHDRLAEHISISETPESIHSSLQQLSCADIDDFKQLSKNYIW